MPFYLGDVGDLLMLGRISDEHPIAAVLHFAGDIVVPESVSAPLTYYATKTCKTRQLLQLCVERRCSGSFNESSRWTTSAVLAGIDDDGSIVQRPFAVPRVEAL